MIKKITNLQMRKDCDLLEFTVMDGELVINNGKEETNIDGGITIVVNNLRKYTSCAEHVVLSMDEARGLRDILDEAIKNVEKEGY